MTNSPMYTDMMGNNQAAPMPTATTWSQCQVQVSAQALIKCEAAMHHGDPEAELLHDNLSADLKFTISNNMLLLEGTINFSECAKQFDLAILEAHEATDQQYCY